MFTVSTWFEFIAVLLVVISKAIGDYDYSTVQCRGIATQCEGPTQEQIELYKKALIQGGCSKFNTEDEIKRFSDCAMKFNPELFKNISDLTGDNQPCRDETGLTFELPGLLGDCQVYGTPLADCLVRCSTCLRLPKFGYDSTEVAIKTFAACPLVKNSSYGTSY